MFTDDKTLNTIHAFLDCSLMRATHRPQDLIPAFEMAIRDTPEYTQIIACNSGVPSYAVGDDSADYWHSEDALYYLDELFDVLDSYAPEGYYFGAIEGDGSDFGYWKIEGE